jgi:phosphate transport system permease protein
MLNFFKNKPKENLVAGIFLFTSAIISLAPGMINIVNGVNSLSFSIVQTNEYFSIAIFSLLMTLPSLVLFSVTYLLWEGHSYGWKLSIAACGVVLLLSLTNSAFIYFALPIAVLSALAALLQFRIRKTNENKTKHSPMVIENLVKLGLRLSTIFCVMVVVVMVVYIVIMASPFLSIQFFTSMTLNLSNVSRICWGVAPIGPVGGVMAFAIGSILVVTFCEFVAVPIGVCAAIYLAEYSSQNRVVGIIRFFIETLAGTPSVVMAIIGFTIFTITFKWYDSLWGTAITLSFLALPWNIRVAEGALKSVPRSYREASFALGATKWQTTRLVTLYAALPGIVTGILLGVGVALGETLVLLWNYTASNTWNLPTPWWHIFSLNQPLPSLTVFIKSAPGSSNIMGGNIPGGNADNVVFYSWSLAFAAALVLIVMYLGLCIGALLLRNYLNKRMKGN